MHALRRIRRRARRALREASPAAAGARARQRNVPGAIALTFDDGPDPRFTPQVLEVLAEAGVPATFFLVGARAAAHPDLVRRIVREGHAVGSHSRSHPDPWTLRWPELLGEYRDGRRLVEAAAARPLRLFRPPKGHIDLRGAGAMRLSGLRPWLWTIDPEDWQPSRTSDEILGALAGLGPGDVVLLHDGICGAIAPAALDRSATVTALPAIVALAHRRGLAFARLE